MSFDVDARRGPRPPRRERRRQVDAAEDHLRCAAAGRGTIEFDGSSHCLSRRPRRRWRSESSRSTRSSTHFHPDRRRECVSRPRAASPAPSSAGRPWPDTRAHRRALRARSPPTRLVRDLSVAQQQMVEIARALSVRSRLIIMDEPTSALSETESQRLFAIMRDLRREGIGTIFVTHRLSEVLADLRPRHRPARRPAERQGRHRGPHGRPHHSL